MKTSLQDEIDLLERLESFWNNSLKSDRAAQNYLKSRGVTFEMVEKFKLGFSNWHNPPRPKICSITDEKEVALYRDLGFESKNGRDKFHQRIMVPFQDMDGKIVGFTGRAINSELPNHIPKYMRTRFTEKQSSDVAPLLLHGSRGAIDESKSLLVVEGVFDALVLQSVGFRNTVALQGSETQINGRFFADEAKRGIKIVFMFDRDKGGDKGRFACLEKIIPEIQGDEEFFYANVPEKYQDPAEVIEKKKAEGAELIQNEIYAALSIEEEITKYFGGDDTPVEQKSIVFARLSRIIESTNENNKAVHKIINTVKNCVGIDLSEVKEMPGNETDIDYER